MPFKTKFQIDSLTDGVLIREANPLPEDHSLANEGLNKAREKMLNQVFIGKAGLIIRQTRQSA